MHRLLFQIHDDQTTLKRPIFIFKLRIVQRKPGMSQHMITAQIGDDAGGGAAVVCSQNESQLS